MSQVIHDMYLSSWRFTSIKTILSCFYLLFQIYSQALQCSVRKRPRIQSIELSLQEPTALSVQKTWLLLHSIRVVIKSRVQVKKL